MHRNPTLDRFIPPRAARGRDHLDNAPAFPRDGTDASSCEEEYPCYTERQMQRRLARHPTLPLSESVPGLPAPVAHYLLASALREALDILHLTPMERAIAEMRLTGASVREIARETGLKKWRVERAMAAIRRAYRLARRTGSFGWQEVYLAETRRM